MKRVVTAVAMTVAWLVQNSVSAQDAGSPAEKHLVAEAIHKLDAYAEQCRSAAARTRARIAWLEIVSEYDKDHDTTRKKLGHVRVGSVWSLTEDMLPEPDDVAARVLRKLDSAWRTLARELGAAHLKVARTFIEEGNKERAHYHYRRTLRFAPTISAAGKALGLQPYQGTWLTPIQLEILLRERLLRQLVDVLNKTEFEVLALPQGQQNKWLEHAKKGMSRSFRGFKGPTAEVWGDLQEGILRAVVQDVERCNLLSRGLLCGYSGFRWEVDDAPMFLLTTWEDRYHAFIDSNDKTATQKEFQKQHVSGIWLGSLDDNVFATWVSDELDRILDTIARQCIAHAGDARAFALTEGYGHAGCAWLHGKTLSFFFNLAEKKTPKKKDGRTTSAGRAKRTDGEPEEFLIPEIGYWRDLVLQQAWEGSGPGIAELMLFTAQNTPHQARIKAWSVIHYLMVRDPTLLRLLDKATEQASDSTEVRKRFDAISPVTMLELERGWRSYWRADEARLAPWRDRSAKDSGERKVERWLQQISLWRAKHRLAPFGYAPGLPDTVRRLLRKPAVLAALDARQQPEGLDVDTLRDEKLWGQLLVVPKRFIAPKLSEELFLVPGYRDLFCAPVLGIVRYGVISKGAVLCVPRIAVPKSPCPAFFYPEPGDKTVSGRFPVAALGDMAIKLYDMEWDVGGAKEIGYPLSLHLGPMDPDYDPDVSCEVFVEGRGVGVTIVEPREGLPRKLSIPGVYFCFPRRPLPSGKRVRVNWKWYPPGRGEERKQLEFTAR